MLGAPLDGFIFLRVVERVARAEVPPGDVASLEGTGKEVVHVSTSRFH